MRSTIESIVELQDAYSSENTPEMRRRGVLVRDGFVADILGHRGTLAAVLGSHGTDLAVTGRDGTGRKAMIPWTRVYSRRLSPTPQDGWYVVYLFHPDGSGVSLCLSHGSTTFDAGEFRQKGDDEVAALMSWASLVLATHAPSDPEVSPGVKLGSADLAAAYERTTVLSKFYRKGSIPTDAALYDDLGRFLGLLKILYDAQDAGLTPGQSGAEVQQLLTATEELASPLRGKGQGRGLPFAARKAVELHAMAMARDWLTAEGFAYKDVSATHSCDFVATREGSEWVVEVKGTTGGAGSILLTRNEVRLHRERFPKNILIVVHGVKLGADGYTTTGGTVLVLMPWRLDDERLLPTAFEYRLPA